MKHPRAQELSELLKALAHATRLQILEELGKGTKCVTDIKDLLPVSQANVSQHLAILRHAKLVNFAQDAALRCYYLSRPSLVKGVLSVLARDHRIVEKSMTEIEREKIGISRRKGRRP
jgi:ArsR family transcriptional regulator